MVDDEPLFCEMMRKFLVGKGYSVVEANDGDEALAVYRQERPDVVLLDYADAGQGRPGDPPVSLILANISKNKPTVSRD